MPKLRVNMISKGKYWRAFEDIPEDELPPFALRYAINENDEMIHKRKVKLYVRRGNAFRLVLQIVEARLFERMSFYLRQQVRWIRQGARSPQIAFFRSSLGYFVSAKESSPTVQLTWDFLIHSSEEKPSPEYTLIWNALLAQRTYHQLDFALQGEVYGDATHHRCSVVGCPCRIDFPRARFPQLGPLRIERDRCRFSHCDNSFSLSSSGIDHCRPERIDTPKAPCVARAINSIIPKLMVSKKIAPSGTSKIALNETRHDVDAKSKLC